jgi:hypothetical protein
VQTTYRGVQNRLLLLPFFFSFFFDFCFVFVVVVFLCNLRLLPQPYTKGANREFVTTNPGVR